MVGMWERVAQGVSAGFARTSVGLGERVPALGGAIIVLLLTWWLSRFIKGMTRRFMARTSTTGHVDVIVSRSAQAVVALVGIVVSLAVAGVNVVALVTSLGIVGVTVGFALKDVLANYVAGIVLLAQRPFRVGDSITVDEVEGTVVDVDSRATVLRAADGTRVYVPNSTVFNAVVTNSSLTHERRFEVSVTVREGVDGLDASARAVAVLSEVPGVLAAPAPTATLAEGEQATTRVIAHGWVDTRHTTVSEAANMAYGRLAAELR